MRRQGRLVVPCGELRVDHGPEVDWLEVVSLLCVFRGIAGVEKHGYRHAHCDGDTDSDDNGQGIALVVTVVETGTVLKPPPSGSALNRSNHFLISMFLR